MKNLLNFFTQKQPEIGQAWIEEVMPKFQDRASTTNKTIYTVTSLDSYGIAEVIKVPSGYGEKTTEFKQNKVLTQKEIPIKFTKKGALKYFDKHFSKNKYETGQVYVFEALGFLGNLESINQVKVVTDNYVIFDNKNYGSLSTYSFEELERINPKLKIKTVANT